MNASVIYLFIFWGRDMQTWTWRKSTLIRVLSACLISNVWMVWTIVTSFWTGESNKIGLLPKLRSLAERCNWSRLKTSYYSSFFFHGLTVRPIIRWIQSLAVLRQNLEAIPTKAECVTCFYKYFVLVPLFCSLKIYTNQCFFPYKLTYTCASSWIFNHLFSFHTPWKWETKWK